MPIELPPLPFAKNALEPHISSRTLEFHYGKHHQAYVDKVNAALKDKNSDEDLESLIKTAEGGLFNNAAQVWNHTFYWNCLTPDGPGEPDPALQAALDADFGSVAKCKEELAEAAKGHFGSGWAWLVMNGGKLRVISTSDAENPMRDGKTPLLTIDVWEHAYYLDYQNDRPGYVSAIVDRLLNWSFASENYAANS